jgi:hypothetical protein
MPAAADGVVQAKVLPRLIEGGMVSTALVTHVVASKFVWYLPLYRQVGHASVLDADPLPPRRLTTAYVDAHAGYVGPADCLWGQVYPPWAAPRLRSNLARINGRTYGRFGSSGQWAVVQRRH